MLSERNGIIFPYFEDEATSTQPINTSPTMKSIGQLTYSVKGYIVNTFGFLGPKVSDATTVLKLTLPLEHENSHTQYVKKRMAVLQLSFIHRC